MDALTHVFVPLTVAYVLFPETFQRRRTLALAGFGLFSDFDKFLGVPGFFHSLVTLVPVCLVLLAAEKYVFGSNTYSPFVVAFVLSHLFLDVIDGGPVPILAPFVDVGVGLRYPMQVSFGEGILGIVFEGPFLLIATKAPRPGFNTYGFVNAFGVTSMLLFLVLYAALDRRRRRSHPT